MISLANSKNNITAINDLAKNYNPLDYINELHELLRSIYPDRLFSKLSKYELHALLNKTLLEYYKGEEILKYKLSELFFKNTSIVAAFEIKVNTSRADFLTINGHTTSYEIKSSLDNLSKLRKQTSDYLLAFEYNYLVIDEIHIEKAIELIPNIYGLWCYKNGKYKKLRKAQLNNQINPVIQLGLLNKKELQATFPDVNGTINLILEKYTHDLINRKFKTTLKNRYKDRWDFIVQNRNAILPIDIQFFFNNNIHPNCIYHN